MKPIILPWPSKDLSPNARVHWARKALAASKAREDGRLAAIASGWHKHKFGEGRIYLLFEFYPPTRRGIDDDNAIARCKNARDGIADAIGANDRKFVCIPYVHDETRKGGEVVVSLLDELCMQNLVKR